MKGLILIHPLVHDALFIAFIVFSWAFEQVEMLVIFLKSFTPG